MNKNKKLKRYSLVSLVIGYTLATSFIILILANRVTDPVTISEPNIKIVEVNNTIIEERLVYTPTPSAPPQYVDHLQGVVLNDPDPVFAVVKDRSLYVGRDVTIDDTHRIGAVENVTDITGHARRDRVHHRDRLGRHVREDVYSEDVDLGLLDRRLAEDRELFRDDTDARNSNVEERFGLDKDGVNFSQLTIAKDNDESELGEIDIDFDNNKNGNFGIGKGELYAYNYPSRGVGAGIGSSAVGAGSGAGAGLGAGIGEAINGGETVPTLGGVGTYTSTTSTGTSTTAGGVGGLVGGAGAGGAAGLLTGMVTEPLGSPGYGNGGPGHGGYNYKHLPKDGALHIMMHVDGSGSILNTRKQLDIMKDTILREALLPYYKNDVNLYNRRVTIVSSSGERTLQFFTEAADKGNVLAIAFQDEAQPSYHLPTFNKKPQDHYSKDLSNLKASLDGYSGVYRGVMFQVDRGNTFAKSFKEFVTSAFQGEGYLQSDNLKKYYIDNNNHLIKNKQGVVFSDEYHAKDSGTPEYYMDLIFQASKRIGLDLDIYGAGLSDGKITVD